MLLLPLPLPPLPPPPPPPPPLLLPLLLRRLPQGQMISRRGDEEPREGTRMIHPRVIEQRGVAISKGKGGRRPGEGG